MIKRNIKYQRGLAILFLILSFIFIFKTSFSYLKLKTHIFPGVKELIGEINQLIPNLWIYYWIFGLIMFMLFLIIGLKTKLLTFKKSILKRFIIYTLDTFTIIIEAIVIIFIFVPNFNFAFRIVLLISGFIIFYMICFLKDNLDIALDSLTEFYRKLFKF